MWHLLRREGHAVGRDRVARLMAAAGLRGLTRAKSQTSPPRRRLDRFYSPATRPSAPGQWWVAESVRVATAEAPARVAFVTDMFSRRIMAWALGDGGDPAEQAIAAAARDNALHFAPSDGDGVARLADADHAATILRIGQESPAGGGGAIRSLVTDPRASRSLAMEWTVGLYLTEVLQRFGPPTPDREALAATTAHWVTWYNTARLHSGIAYRPPDEAHHTGPAQ
jgi:transposase InsO family protein